VIKKPNGREPDRKNGREINGALSLYKRYKTEIWHLCEKVKYPDDDCDLLKIVLIELPSTTDGAFSAPYGLSESTI